MHALTIFFIVLGSLAIGLVCALVWALKREQKPTPTPGIKRTKSVEPAPSEPQTSSKTKLPLPIGHPARGFPPLEPSPAKTQQTRPSPDPKMAQLHRRLCSLLQGDERAVSRLISAAQSRYPEHDHFWYLEKVLEDLERDRRA
jgi:hypothetical protein